MKNLGRKRGQANGQSTDLIEQLKLYCAAHPGSPVAVRRPQLLMRGKLWIAILGPNGEEGIVGIGATVEAALQEFDRQYLDRLRPESIRQRRNR